MATASEQTGLLASCRGEVMEGEGVFAWLGKDK